jgi:Fe-S-cluster containining protein
MSTKVRVSPLIATRSSLETLQARFSCRRCGWCCTKFVGLILTKNDMLRLGVPEAEWATKFTVMDKCYVLTQPCRYFDDAQHACQVYEKRPDICRDFPVHNIKCADGLHHLGVAAECEAAIEALKQVEVETGIRLQGKPKIKKE